MLDLFNLIIVHMPIDCMDPKPPLLLTPPSSLEFFTLHFKRDQKNEKGHMFHVAPKNHVF